MLNFFFFFFNKEEWLGVTFTVGSSNYLAQKCGNLPGLLYSTKFIPPLLSDVLRSPPRSYSFKRTSPTSGRIIEWLKWGLYSTLLRYSSQDFHTNFKDPPFQKFRTISPPFLCSAQFLNNIVFFFVFSQTCTVTMLYYHNFVFSQFCVFLNFIFNSLYF